MNKEFLRKTESPTQTPHHQFSDVEHETRGHSSDRIERQVEYSPTGSNPMKIFAGFENSQFLSNVGSRVPKSIPSLDRNKERVTKSISSQLLPNINEPLFYPDKRITPPRYLPSERAFGTTRSPPLSPYAPKFEYQVTPTYSPKPLAY